LKIINASHLESLRNKCRSAAEGRTGSRQIIVNMGTCGIASGSKRVSNFLKNRIEENGLEVHLKETGCCGVCHQEPMMTIIDPDGTVSTYGELTDKKLQVIYDKHVVDGQPVEELRIDGDSQFFRKQVKRVTRLLGLIDPQDIMEYIAQEGYMGLAKALSLPGEEVIEEVKESGLKGRGGAGFPTGLKWSFASGGEGDVKYIICNADEGDPGAYMDRAIVEGNPHSVLEGMIIAGYAIGANHGYVYIRAEYPLAVEILRNAIDQARDYGMLGKGILGSDFDFDVEIYLGAGAFVCGEETALIASMEGRRGNPRPKPPFPANSGLFGKPTIINNVKTLSSVPLILHHGSAWFASVGTEKSKGTMIFSLTGKVNRTGLIEVPLGITLGEIIFDIGGGIPGGKRFKAIQLGGPSGGCIPGKYLNTPVDYQEIEALGAIMGSGGMIVMDEDSCMPDMARFFMEFTKEESCGKCTPCRAGIPQMLRMLDSICCGTAREEDLELLEKLGNMIKDCSLCGLGQTAPNPFLSTLRHFREEYLEHIVSHRCPACVCQSLYASPCQHACPLNTNIPGVIELIRAGNLEDAYLLIRQFNPFPSICGRVCVHFCESKCQRSQVDEPLGINSLLRYATDRALAKGVDYVPSIREHREENVAIVGSGPAGLSAAHDLAVRGYEVTIFEEGSMSGGWLRWGIPEYRLPREILDKDLEIIQKLGVKIKLGSRVDDPGSLLENGYTAVFLAIGLQKGRKIGIRGEDLDGVIQGVDFLRRVNSGEKPEVGKRVVVVGGGNVAVDVARVCVRLGAERVQIVYRRRLEDMPAIEEEIDGALDEGVEILELTSPRRILDKGNGILGVECVRMMLQGFDESCRKIPVEKACSELSLDADILIEAVGQTADGELHSLSLNRGLVVVDSLTLETDMPGVFAGGDVIRGASTVVEAIADGQRAATSIDNYIRGRPIPRIPGRLVDLEIEIPPGEVRNEVLEHPRVAKCTLKAGERTGNFKEIVKGYPEKEALEEACRCLRCDLEV